MKHKLLSFLIILLGIFIFSNAYLQEQKGERERETVLDRKVHIEKDLILDIPQVPRWCDQLDLIKRRVNVGDAELYVEEEGQGMPIVLINGGPGGTHHYFHPHFSRAKNFARIIYYDQRGCGLSDFKKGKGYSVEQAVDDLENLRKALKISRWVVLGYSYGGFLAQYYAVTYPESLAGLVLMGSSLGMHVCINPTRQYDYLSKEEKERLKEIRKEVIKLLLEKKIKKEQFIETFTYNSFINGDWKRQHYIKPSKERIARMALYEWKNDDNFNSILNRSMGGVDLKGAFEKCPIPTLILEGKWDLTWNTDKPQILSKNHPGSEMVIFENSGHGPYENEPEKFFKVLKDFLQNLSQISDSDLAIWKNYLVEWKRKKKESKVPLLRSAGWGRKSNERIGEEVFWKAFCLIIPVYCGKPRQL